jgi:hypothetical protein
MIQGCVAAVQPPLISEPKVDARIPLKPGEEAGISVDVFSTIGTSLIYTWYADGGEIVRGQGSPAITYRAPDKSGIYNVRVAVKWDGQTLEKATSIKVEEESTPTPMLQSLTDTPVPPTGTPTVTLAEVPIPSPNAARQQLAPLDQNAQEFDTQVAQMRPEALEEAECPYIEHASGGCWIYRIGAGNLILVEGYYAFGVIANLGAYDFDDDEQPEILKWDLGSDDQFDIIEYDVDGDGILDFALADVNANGQFDEEEIYLSAAQGWQPLGTNGLPFPVLPLFSY